MTETVLVDIRGEVAVVTLNRPETANTLDLAMPSRASCGWTRP